jgi:hypothetical protein
LTGRIVTPNAMPALPAVLLASPAASVATIVPWPLSSFGCASSCTKSQPARKGPGSSGDRRYIVTPGFTNGCSFGGIG